MLRLSILCFLNYCFLVFEDLMNLTGSTHPTNTSPGYLPKYILAFVSQRFYLQWHLQSSLLVGEAPLTSSITLALK